MKTALALCTLLTIPSPGSAQDVYAILVGDTDVPDIGSGVAKSLSEVKKLLNEARDEGGLSVIYSEVKGDDFSCNEILHAVHSAQWTPNDTVLFYYAGHGFRRDSSQTKFPEFDCHVSRSDGRATQIGIADEIYSTSPSVGNPSPRLLIAIADACNTFLSNTTSTPSAGPAPPAADRKAGFRKLLLGYKGEVLISSSVPGEPSFYLTDGYFTSNLLKAIRTTLSKPPGEITWDVILNAAVEPINVPTAEHATIQHPQYDAHLLQPIAGFK